jgi:S-DNA-T family DNA segregation ATPase FtsK/SpoIIIE
VVYEGEVISDRAERSSRLPSVVVDTVTVLRPSPATKRRARTLKGHSVLVLAGWHSWIVRAKDGLTSGDIREQIRIARATGDHEALERWIDKRREAKNDRFDRLMKLPLLVLKMAILTVCCLLAVPVLLVVASTVVWATGAGGWTDLWVWFGGVLRWLIGAAKIAWLAFVLSSPLLLVWAGHREGRRSTQTTPAWLADDKTGESDSGRDVIPDEGAILNALRHLEIAALNKAFKAGWRPRFVLPTERDGNGYHTQLELPPAVPVEKIVDKKRTLAHNLVRFPIEVWPTEPRGMPGVLDLWVADQGALSGPVPDWPLLHEGTTDYFKSVPCAVDIRRRNINGRLFEANYAIAGMMGSGKSSLIITLLLGALLDPLVDADVFCMADNADYDPMEPRLRTLMTGTGEDVAEACLATMSEIYNELSVRGKALKEHGVRAASRALAEKDERLRPRVIVIDECQALFLHEKYGAKALETAVKTENAARKYAVTIIYATPEASSDSLPRRLVAITSNKACFAIGDQTSNDAILGTGSYREGISAVGLEPKTDESLGDVGTFMGRGFTPKPSLLRSYFVSQSQAVPVVQRSLQIREKAGYGSAGSAAALQQRDLLEDLASVAGGQRARLADAASLLRDLAPNWIPYRDLTGTRLRDILVNKHGVRVTNSGNVLRLDVDSLRDALAARKVGGE